MIFKIDLLFIMMNQGWFPCLAIILLIWKPMNNMSINTLHIFFFWAGDWTRTSQWQVSTLSFYGNSRIFFLAFCLQTEPQKVGQAGLELPVALAVLCLGSLCPNLEWLGWQLYIRRPNKTILLSLESPNIHYYIWHMKTKQDSKKLSS